MPGKEIEMKLLPTFNAKVLAILIAIVIASGACGVWTHWWAKVSGWCNSKSRFEFPVSVICSQLARGNPEDSALEALPL